MQGSGVFFFFVFVGGGMVRFRVQGPGNFGRASFCSTPLASSSGFQPRRRCFSKGRITCPDEVGIGIVELTFAQVSAADR